jgi:signal transduction histidine kinase
MTLRLKLVLAILAVAIPLRFSMVRTRAADGQRLLEGAYGALTRAHMHLGGLERCQAAPQTWREQWSEPDKQLELFAFDPALSSRNPAAPPLATELLAAMRDGADTASRTVELAGQRGTEVLVRVAGSGHPCTFVLTRISGALPGRAPQPLTFLPVLCAMGAVLLAMGPTVRRIRRLGREVQASAREHYRVPVNDRGTDEIAKLARAFNAARLTIRSHLDLLDQREQALRTSMADTTHDVLTPLSTLRCQLEQLRKELAGGGSAPRAIVSAALDEAHYLGALVHNLGVAARLDAGTPELVRHPINLNEMITHVVLRHRPIAAQHQVALESALPEEPLWVEADSTMVEQAISNVVHNAIRYNHAGGHVAVVLEAGREGGSTVRVLDDGPGIPEGEISRMTERSVRGREARRRQPQGQGLGLNIAHRVASVHGWRLTLAPSEFGGLEVEFTAPG